MILLRALFCLLVLSSPALAWTFGAAPGAYEGLVATRAQPHAIATLDTTNKQMQVRSTHWTRAATTSVKVVAQNFYLSNSNTELGLGATATVAIAVEYPAGTCHQTLFSGSVDGTIPDVNVLFSDATSVSIPANTQFWIQQFWRSTGGLIYESGHTQVAGEAFKVAVSGLTDQTGTCAAITGGSGSGMAFPLGIVSVITTPSVCLTGDSVASGLQASATAQGERGYIQAIGPVFGYSNLSSPNQTISAFLTNSTQRRKIFPYCSHAINQLGAADLVLDSLTAAQLQTRLNSLYSLFSGVQFQTTFTPGTTTTDGCTTLAGQSPIAYEPNREQFNTNLRTGAFAPNSGAPPFDPDTVFETSLNSGFWVTATHYSGDCVHPNTAAYVALVSANVINTSRITRFAMEDADWSWLIGDNDNANWRQAM